MTDLEFRREIQWKNKVIILFYRTWVSGCILKAVKNLPLALISLGSPIGSSYSHEVVDHVLCSLWSGRWLLSYAKPCFQCSSKIYRDDH